MYQPLFGVEVLVVDIAPGQHDMTHLLEEDAVVALDDGESFFLHLHLLELEVEVEVSLRRLVVNHGHGCVDDGKMM